MNRSRHRARWPPRIGVGLALVGICWPLNWSLPGARTAYLFFPLWLGYILVLDALVERRMGSSLWTRSRTGFVLLFVVSAPVWWLFELINSHTRNWEYLGVEQFGWLEYNVLCTLSFSTVMPAVFETAEWVRSFGWIDHFASGPRVPRTRQVRLGILMAGLTMLGLMLAWPGYFYCFVWMALVLILEPLNNWLSRPHLLSKLHRGDWRELMSLSFGALICGFFWEMWNDLSYPKWIYHTPGVEFLHVFEMPLLGYFGYIPFAFELYLLKGLLWSRGPRLSL